MKRNVLCGLLIALMVAPALADVISLKDGSVIECKFITQKMAKGKPVYVIELEGGKRQEIVADTVAWIAKAKPSWEVRTEQKAWYAKELQRREKKLDSDWKTHEQIARNCKRKKYLAEQTEKHYLRAYELRKPTVKETIKAHEKMAKWLEKTCGLFAKAAEHWLWVFEKKAADVEQTDKKLASLAKWAEKRSLYKKAKEYYEKALALNPKYSTALKGVERIKNMQGSLLNPRIYRTVAGPVAKAAAFLRKKKNKDGSFGADVKIAGIHGLRAMTALSAMALIADWTFASAGGGGGEPPAEASAALNYIFSCETVKEGLRGPDVWGNIFTVYTMAMILKHPKLKRLHGRAKTRIKECLTALGKMQTAAGGWAYYHHNKKNENSFTGSILLASLAMARERGATFNEEILKRGLANLKKQKQSDGVWMYKKGARQKVEGSQGRAATCELALYLHGEGSMQALKITAENFFKYRHILEAVKGKKGTHMGSGGTAPYYFLYGHMGISLMLHQFEPELRDKYMGRLRDLFLKDQESNGSYSEWPRTKEHDIYGTAMGIMTLYHIGTMMKRQGEE